MKKGLFLLIIILVVILSACDTEKIIPLEDPQHELFSTLYEGDGYTILKRTEIDESQYYYMIAYYIDDGTRTCILGHYHIVNYRVLYNDNYYDILQGAKFDLYSCAKLIELEIINN